MVFEMIDGNKYQGESYSDIVRQMAEGKLTAPQDVARYRRATARRVKDAYNLRIDPSSNRRFVQSMERHGLMKRMQ